MNIFIDSSIFIEYLKGRGVSFLNEMIENHHLFTNQIVASEFLYKFIGIHLQKSPMSVKESKEISLAFVDNLASDILKTPSYLPCNELIATTGLEFMKKYNLLPNDSFILASCKLNKIKFLATYDKDFIVPCLEQGISILNDVSQISKL